MIEFYDSDTHLKYKCYTGKETTYGSYDDEYFNYIYQMNLWDDEGIKKYLTESTPLGNFLNWNNAYFGSGKQPKGQLILAFDDDILVGTALITTNNNSIAFQLKPTNYKLLSALCDSNQRVHFEFIATDPLLRGQGYGTRIIKGIKNNINELTNNKEISGITANVRDTNLPSQKAFLKNKFIIVSKNHLFKSTNRHLTFYSGKHAEILKNE